MELPLCRHKVSIYRHCQSIWQRQVADGCFCTWKELPRPTVTGDGIRREFFLVLPGRFGPVRPGDWIVEGDGPEQVSAPSQIPGAEKITWAKQMRDPGIFGPAGRLIHTEAGNA